MTNSNRLAKLLKGITNKLEIPYKEDADGLGANVGIPDGKEMIVSGYSFHENEDSYEFGSALAKINKSQIPEVSQEIATSDPIRGITERIDPKTGVIQVWGSRDNLSNQPDEDIQKGYMDDWARTAQAYDVVKGILKKIGNKGE